MRSQVLNLALCAHAFAFASPHISLRSRPPPSADSVLNSLVFNKGYERGLKMAGAVRSSVKAPTDQWPPQPLPPEGNLSYCNQKMSPTGKFSPMLPCVYPDMDSLGIVTPGDNGALLIGTRYSSTLQTRDRKCDVVSDYACKPWVSGEKQSFYVGGLESCTIVIQHSVAKAVQREYAGNNQEYILDSFSRERPVAWIHGPPVWNAEHERYEPARSVPVEKKAYGDQVTVEKLLYVLDIDIDALRTDHTKTPPSNTSDRYDGQVRLSGAAGASNPAWRLPPRCRGPPLVPCRADDPLPRRLHRRSRRMGSYRHVRVPRAEERSGGQGARPSGDRPDTPRVRTVHVRKHAHARGHARAQVTRTDETNSTTREMVDLHGLQLLFSQV